MNHLAELVDYAIEGIKDRGEGTEGSELHNTLFNEDYYLIGRARAEKWLSQNGGIFPIIDEIKEYEQDNFGEVTTDFSEPEHVANMFVYIKGEEILAESATLADRWNEPLSAGDVRNIISELEVLL